MPDIRRASKLPKPDERGRIRPFVGRTEDGRKARFFVGDQRTAPATAMRRLELIRLLYEKQCERHKVDFWRDWARRVAVKIGSGQSITDVSFADDTWPNSAKFRASMVSMLQSWGIPVQVDEPQALASGLAQYQDEITELVQKLVVEELSKLKATHGEVVEVSQRSLPDDPLLLAETTSLHKAIDAYSRHLKDTGKRDSNGNLSTYTNKCVDRLRYLKEAHDDLPLWRLMDFLAIERMVAHWRNRPNTAKGERCSKSHAKDQLKELWRFFRWLSNHKHYRWDWPKGSEQIKRTPIDLPQDETSVAFQTTTKQTYSPEQLSQLMEHTDDFGRVLIATCVNCAFGASEIGQWPVSKFILFRSHPHAAKLGIETTDEDSWIVGNRPKTKIYGEHLLWKPVATALKPFVSDGRQVLPITRNNTDWYKTHSKNPQTKFTNWWSDLVERTQKKYKDLPSLPFGSLRDTFPDVLRQNFSDDVASLALQHGSLSEDQLLKCYANMPFGRLFQATRELETFFEPVLKMLGSESA